MTLRALRGRNAKLKKLKRGCPPLFVRYYLRWLESQGSGGCSVGYNRTTSHNVREPFYVVNFVTFLSKMLTWLYSWKKENIKILYNQKKKNFKKILFLF